MAREYFYDNEEKMLNRLLVLKELVAEQNLREKPCPMLAAQLNDLVVLCGLLQLYVCKLAECVEKACHEE